MLVTQRVSLVADGQIGMDGGHRLAHVTHIGGARSRAGIGLACSAPQRMQRSTKAPRQREVVAQALVALALADVHLDAGQRGTPRAALGERADALQLGQLGRTQLKDALGALRDDVYSWPHVLARHGT